MATRGFNKLFNLNSGQDSPVATLKDGKDSAVAALVHGEDSAVASLGSGERSQRLANKPRKTPNPPTRRKPKSQPARKRPEPKNAAIKSVRTARKKPAADGANEERSLQQIVPAEGDSVSNEASGGDDDELSEVPVGQTKPDNREYTDEEWRIWLASGSQPTTPSKSIAQPKTPVDLPAMLAGVSLNLGIPAPKTPPLQCEIAMKSTMNFDELLLNVCCKCKEPICPLRAYGKSPATWRCSSCNVKCVGLYKKYGKWPTPQFNEFDEEEQTEYYKSIKNVSMTEAEKILVNRLIKKRRDWEENKHKGEWLPLSVWQSRGFDPEVIERTSDATNSKPDRRFGMLYRVFIETDARGMVTERERISELRAELCQGKKRKRANLDEEEQEIDIIGKEAAKKQKLAAEREAKAKEAADQRATELEAIRAKKESDKQGRLSLTTATKSLAKCTPLETELAKLQKEKQLAKFGDYVVNKVDAAKTEIDRIQKEAKEFVKMKKNHTTISFSMQDVQMIAGEASEAIKLAQGMLRTLKNIKK